MSTVGDLLKRKGSNVYWIEPLESVYDALKEMKERDCGALCVMIEQVLVGIVSERDYVRHVILDNKTSKLTKVSEIMTRDVVKVTSDDEVETCLNLMKEHRFRHLPVVDDGKVVGVLSLRDLFIEAIEKQH